MKRLLWMALLLIVPLVGCQKATWSFRKERTPQVANHTSKGTDERTVEVTAAGTYEVIKLPDGSYFIRPIPGKGE